MPEEEEEEVRHRGLMVVLAGMVVEMVVVIWVRV
jgi:hypothetical protein